MTLKLNYKKPKIIKMKNMKNIILFVCILIANSIFAQKFNTIKTPTKAVMTAPKVTTTGVASLKNIAPVPGGKTNFVMVRGNGRTTENIGTKKKENDANGRYCTTVNVDASRGYNEQMVLGNQIDKVYPGAIYYDNAFITGNYNAPVGLGLQPYNITTSLSSAASTGSSAIQVQPSMSGVKDGIAQLMRQNRNVINAALGGFEVKQVSSVDQLAFEVGAGFAGYNAELRASLSINNENRKNVYFAKLTQVYFDINTDIQNPNNLIAASNSNTNLVYVNKVSYGRIAIIQVSSDYSKEEIQAALDFAYTGGNVSVDANAELNYNKVRQSSEIKGLFLGGNAENTVNVTNFDQLKSFNQYIQNGLRWDPNVAPTPVSYQLKYINDNTVATTQATTSFTQKNCIVGSGVKIKLHGIAIDETNNTCGCTWGNISVKLLEMDGNGNFVKEIFAKGGAGSEYWNVPGDRPTRVIKLSEVQQQDAKKTVNMDRFDAINAERIYTIDPEVYANNRVIVEFTMKATTDHKDNDFAKQGIHGMPRAETRTIPLQELIPESATKPTAEADKPLYTYKLGGFASNTDRIKIFNALFTISVAK